MKKIVCLLLAVMVCSSMCLPVLATDQTVPVGDDYLTIRADDGTVVTIPAEKTSSGVADVMQMRTGNTVTIHEETYQVELDPETAELMNITSGSVNENGVDGGAVVRADVTLYYLKDNSGTFPSYLLTQVTGSWTVLSNQVQLSNMYVYYTCSGSVAQTATHYPTSTSYSYVTGFTTYAPDNGNPAYAAGAITRCTINRGTSSWQFELNTHLF